MIKTVIILVGIAVIILKYLYNSKKMKREHRMRPDVKLGNELDAVLANDNRINYIEFFSNRKGKKIIQITLENKSHIKVKGDTDISDVIKILNFIKEKDHMKERDSLIIRVYDQINNEYGEVVNHLKIGLIFSKDDILMGDWKNIGIKDALEIGEKIYY